MNRLLNRDDLVLIGDSALITCGLSAALMAVVLLLSEVMWGDSLVPVWMELVSSIAFFAPMLLGPVLVWLASKRKITVPAVLGVALGAGLSAVVFAILIALTGLFQIALRGIQTEGPWGLVVVGALGLVALAVVGFRLLRDGGADRRRAQPAHLLLDVLRIAAAVIVVVYTAVIIALSLVPQRGEIIEALAFMLIGAVTGACLAAGAAILTRAVAKRGTPPLDAGVSAA